jgi:hypothetical protein
MGGTRRKQSMILSYQAVLSRDPLSHALLSHIIYPTRALTVDINEQ